MRRVLFTTVALVCAAGAKTFTLEQVLSAPFPSELIAAPGGGKVAWLLNERGARIVFLRSGQIWTAPLAGSEKPAMLIRARSGLTAAELEWAPDGSKLAFVSDRVNHSFVAVYDFGAKTLLYLDPSTDRDRLPV